MTAVENNVSASTAPTTIRIFGTAGESFVDGPGVRMAVFVQGCSHHCHGCHNPESQPAGDGYGTVRDIAELAAFALANPMLSGLTLSGGEPFEQAAECAELARQVKELRPDFNVWSYSGYTFEQLCRRAEAGDGGIQALLDMTDVLVDGPYIKERHNISLRFRGSSNQRIIDLNVTRSTGELTLWEDNPMYATHTW